MKKLILILLVTCSILSCSKEEAFDEETFDIEKYPQKWELVKMTGSWSNSVSTGNDMDWQEYYILKLDGTFTKHREQNGVSFDMLGTFSIADYNGEKFIELIHEVENEIIENCYSNQTESLWIKSEKKLLGTSSACDGPGLEYKRVE